MEQLKRKGRVEDYQQNLIPPINDKYIPYGIYDDVYAILESNQFAPLYIHGESGYGKTLSIEQACAKLGREFLSIQITSDTTDENLIGSETLIDGNLVWQDGPITIMARRGGVILLDEICQSTEKIMVIQEVLQHRRFLISRTGEYVYPKDGFMLFATDNTKGNGDYTGRFIGARPQNRALLERFYGFVNQDPPSESIEQKILAYYSDDVKFITTLTRWAASIRKSFKDGASEFEICTRRLIQIVTLKNIFKDDIIALNKALGIYEDDFRDASIELYKSMIAI